MPKKTSKLNDYCVAISIDGAIYVQAKNAKEAQKIAEDASQFITLRFSKLTPKKHQLLTVDTDKWQVEAPYLQE